MARVNVPHAVAVAALAVGLCLTVYFIARCHFLEEEFKKHHTKKLRRGQDPIRGFDFKLHRAFCAAPQDYLTPRGMELYRQLRRSHAGLMVSGLGCMLLAWIFERLGWI